MRSRALVVGICAALAAVAPAAENWPEYRGPTHDGHSDAKGLPLHWSETQNVVWKTVIHDEGHSTPVIWGDQVWLTTATKDGHRLYALCLDRESGKVLRDILVFSVAKPQVKHRENSYASPSPVVEEGRVYVHFGSHGTACLDTRTGRKRWERRDIVVDHQNGPGSTPVLFGRHLFIHFDGVDRQFVVALDKRTGRTAWQTKRSVQLSNLVEDLRKAYGTPYVARVNGVPQLISPGPQAVMGYAPDTGRELWRVRYKGFSNVPRPVVDGSLAFINTGFVKPQLWAVRLGGKGDVTNTHVVWRQRRGIPALSSPILHQGCIYLVSDDGIAACIDAATGDVVWQQRLGGRHWASPILAEGRLYFCAQDGKTTVIRAARQFERLAVNHLNAGMKASPAVSGRSLFLRTFTHLYRIEARTP